MLAFMLGWLWPIGLGGRMPIGGDVTQFSLGLMATLSRSLKAGTLPYWNDLWGYGFPGIGESQMGVFYPPHWILYGFFTPEVGYTASLVAHTLWGSLGVFFAARRFGATSMGAALGAVAWSSCGFFVIHLPHQWGYTSGSWMPWAWGLAWTAMRPGGRPRDALWLAVVLAVQLLPGHFQLAFCTQVGIVVLLAGQAVAQRSTGRRARWRLIAVFLALGGAFLLAAIQISPTLRLARLAAQRRDFEYLSGFAVTPMHLVSLVAPALFERSPLWRPLVWDPFHTSPEECLTYIGLVPLFLAVAGWVRGRRTQPAARALGLLAVVTLLLAMGPYVPGYRYWCHWPGFSFFRGPARWTLATSLALALLAALGFDQLATWRKPGRWLATFALCALAAPAGILALVEVAYASDRPSPVFRGIFDALPWDEIDAYTLAWSAAHQVNFDRRVEETWARQGVDLAHAPRAVFTANRFEIYTEELLGSTALAVSLLAVACLAPRRQAFLVALGLVTIVDLAMFSRQRRVDFGPLASLTSQSPILASMTQGQRTVDRLRNLPMVAGASPVSAYRTLDLPALESLDELASRLVFRPGDAPLVEAARRLTATELRILDPRDRRQALLHRVPLESDWTEVDDPALAGWLLGPSWVNQWGESGRRFLVARAPERGHRAWLLPDNPERQAAILNEWSGSPLQVIEVLRDATPVDLTRLDATNRQLVVRATGPAILVIAMLADPQWRLSVKGPSTIRNATPLRAFGRANQGAWQAVVIPGAGRWVIQLHYEGSDVLLGASVSALALLVLSYLFYRYRGELAREDELDP